MTICQHQTVFPVSMFHKMTRPSSPALMRILGSTGCVLMFHIACLSSDRESDLSDVPEHEEVYPSIHTHSDLSICIEMQICTGCRFLHPCDVTTCRESHVQAANIMMGTLAFGTFSSLTGSKHKNFSLNITTFHGRRFVLTVSKKMNLGITRLSAHAQDSFTTITVLHENNFLSILCGRCFTSTTTMSSRRETITRLL